MQCVAKKYFIKTDACKVCSRRCTGWKHAVRKTQNIGLLEAKHPYFWGKTLVLLPQKYGTFMQRSPMFSISETVAIGLYPEVFCLLVAGSENVCGLLSGRDDGVG